MKKLTIFICIICMIFTMTSCAKITKNLRTNFSYKDPETLGGYWNVTTQTGQTFNHVKCTYWGTEDDTATFVTDDGTLIIQSGAVVCVRCN